MAFEISVVLNLIKKTSSFVLIFLGVTTYGTPKVIKLWLYSFELLKSGGDQIDVFDSRTYLFRVSFLSTLTLIKAGVAELVDAPDLGSGDESRGGSSPFARTTFG